MKKIIISKRKIIIFSVAAIIALGGAYTVWRINTVSADTGVSISAGFGEEVVYAQLTAVRGNEISYQLANKNEQTTDSTTTLDQAGTEKQSFQRGDRPDRSQMTGDMPSMDGMPDMSSMPDMSNMPDMGSMQGMENMPSMDGMPDMSSMPSMTFSASVQTAEDGFTYNNETYILTEEEMTELIPVGTPVTTKLGTVTTFSRLAAGDSIAIIRNTSTGEITAVYIIA